MVFEIKGSGKSRKDEVMKIQSTFNKMKRNGTLFFAAMVALPILQFIIFYICVNFNSILLAFQSYSYDFENRTVVKEWQQIANFQEIFQIWRIEETLQNCLKNSAMYLGISLLIIMPLSLLFAYYIYKQMMWHGFFKVMLFIPGIICIMATSLFYTHFVEWFVLPIIDKQGTIGSIMNNADSSVAQIPQIAFYIILGFSSNLLLFVNAMSGVSLLTIEAAKIDGAGELRTFWNVVLPAIWGTLVSIIVIILAEFGANQAYLHAHYGLNAPDGTETIGYFMFASIFTAGVEDPTRYPFASALGLLLTLLVAPVTLVSKYLLNKFGPSEE